MCECVFKKNNCLPVLLFISFSYNKFHEHKYLYRCIFFDRALLGLRLRLISVWSCQNTSTTRSRTERDTRWSLTAKYVINGLFFQHLQKKTQQHHSWRRKVNISPCCFFFFFTSVRPASLGVTWLACCVLQLCVGWMPFLPLAVSIMCCYYV